MSSTDENNNQIHQTDQATTLPEKVMFDEFCFWWQQDQLSNTATNSQHKLEPQVAKLLTILISANHQVVSRETIEAELWPNTVVDSNSLYQLLTKLRKLLGDSSRQPKYIKTVPKKGYCFICPLKQTPAEKIARKSKSTMKRSVLVWFSIALIVCFAAIASFSSQYFNYQPVTYKLIDVSHKLGLEAEVSAHKSQNLLAYIEDINKLVISSKQGELVYQHESNVRLAFPQWHDTMGKVAFWRYQGDSCILDIMTTSGVIEHSSQPMPCEKAFRPVWKNSQELVLLLSQQHLKQAYLYKVNAKQLVKLPVPLKADETIESVVLGWHQQLYFLLNKNYQTSRLVDLKGEAIFLWDYHVWLIDYNPKNDTVIINDASIASTLVEQAPKQKPQTIATTAQGLFTAVSTDNHGQIFTAIENWQVNIRDSHNIPIFSSSSIDYLPASNALGETAFISRRSGISEVYLLSEGQTRRLSKNLGYKSTRFIQWSPDLSTLMINQFNNLVLFDRQKEIAIVDTQISKPLINVGWVGNDKLYAFDGENVVLYSLKGIILSSFTISAEKVIYHDNRWLVFTQGGLFQHNSLDSAGQQLTQLSAKQCNQMFNVRINNGQLYWQSKWSHQPHIWQYNLNDKNAKPSLITQDHFIWHFDIDVNDKLTIAAMEEVQGDIRVLSPQ